MRKNFDDPQVPVNGWISDALLAAYRFKFNEAQRDQLEDVLRCIGVSGDRIDLLTIQFEKIAKSAIVQTVLGSHANKARIREKADRLKKIAATARALRIMLADTDLAQPFQGVEIDLVDTNFVLLLGESARKLQDFPLVVEIEAEKKAKELIHEYEVSKKTNLAGLDELVSTILDILKGEGHKVGATAGGPAFRLISAVIEPALERLKAIAGRGLPKPSVLTESAIKAAVGRWNAGQKISSQREKLSPMQDQKSA